MSETERLCSRTGYSITQALKILDIRKPRFYEWKKRKGDPNKHNGQIPKSTWILEEEREAILKYFSKNPRNGCRRLSFMMIDENIAYVSPNTVYRVLKSHGLLDTQIQRNSQKGKGFDQPKRPHEQWHIDISYINAGGTYYYLCSILDGFSRFIVHWDIADSMKESDVELIVQKALEKFVKENPRLISDNGPQFKAKEFKVFIRLSGMDQTFTSPYYPQSNGKIERWHKELKKSCIRPRQPRNLKEAKRFIGEFIEHYNYQRLHSAIGYVTPYDKLLGIDSELQRERKNKMAKARQARANAWLEIKAKDSEKTLAKAS